MVIELQKTRKHLHENGYHNVAEMTEEMTTALHPAKIIWTLWMAMDVSKLFYKLFIAIEIKIW